MPGQRKFRLSYRKNHERKKYQSRSLMVSIPRNIYTHAIAPTLAILKNRINHAISLFPGLSMEFCEQYLCICKLDYKFGQLRVVVQSDFSWNAKIDDITVYPSAASTIRSVRQLQLFFESVDGLKICKGNPDEKYDSVRNARNNEFMDVTGRKIVAYFDERNLFSISPQTIRHSECLILTRNDRCRKCEEFRSNLNSLLSRARKRLNNGTNTATVSTDSSSHINYKFLSTPEKIERMRTLKKENRAMSSKLKRIQDKMKEAFDESNTRILDNETSADLCKVLEEEDKFISSTYPENSFLSIFWKTQKDIIAKEGKQKNGIRWHPLIIKWCLYLKHQSSKAYETLRQSGLCLPSQRTLRDYSNAVKAGAGFSLEVDQQLLEAARLSSSPDYHRLVIILIDEMHIKEDLVYDKHSGRLVGFVDLGETNNHLATFEKSMESDDNDEESALPTLAKSVVAFMVRGLFTELRYTYAQFPCASLAGEQMFFPFWDCVARLERIGFKVLAATFDGASVNRKFVAIHDTTNPLLYKVPNIYAKENRPLFFFSDPPHLMKTVRNCWNSKNRCLWNNGKHILWQHVIDLYRQDHGKGTGLAIVPKLKYEHCFLTSFSKMRVDLAAQVLSESVSRALELTGGIDAVESARFARMFDRFFDLLNVSNFYNHKKSHKPDLKPYSSPDDVRLEWLNTHFLNYLDDWEKSVNLRKGNFSDSERKRMLLSTETLLGIKRTVKSFVEFVRYLLSLPEVKDKKLAFLSQNICQDPLENFFGCQRQRGGTSDNPSVSDFFSNTQALRVVDSFCRNPVRGNCRGSGKQEVKDYHCTPLTRRKKVPRPSSLFNSSQ